MRIIKRDRGFDIIVELDEDRHEKNRRKAQAEWLKTHEPHWVKGNPEFYKGIKR